MGLGSNWTQENWLAEVFKGPNMADIRVEGIRATITSEECKREFRKSENYEEEKRDLN